MMDDGAVNHMDEPDFWTRHRSPIAMETSTARPRISLASSALSSPRITTRPSTCASRTTLPAVRTTPGHDDNWKKKIHTEYLMEY